ncbi:hypothetical protein [Clostridium botulinum]|uniref:hypothetical protein n=1 Tax=Clostridium botulinum TaxID=1491 RepID=UPI001E4336F7|nr:hypothetical protein [Clostridium botulinum]MCD3277470.1 hypothetical protein [Clostridium botulinum C/D]MCD3289239.1 hypothetical protein [Clostridium botulinum C/D]MCD3292076.1 hypothetical protein [Clostridium botulinum C/D]MCD3303811.1 hypothetical protein [Clostridium botulinum C/D]
MAKITIENIREYQNRLALVKANGFKVKDFKELGRELRDTFDLTDRQAINILNNKSEEILKILEEE